MDNTFKWDSDEVAEVLQKQAMEKQAGTLARMLPWALGGGLGYAALAHGPEAIKRIGEGFEEHVAEPLGVTFGPAISHLGKHKGKYLGGLASLAAILATRGRAGGIIPQIGMGVAGLGAGTWWDQARAKHNAQTTLWDEKLVADKEKWKNWEDPYDPLVLPASYGGAGTGTAVWKPNQNRRRRNINP